MGLSLGAWLLVVAAAGVGLAIEIAFYRAQKRRSRGSGDTR